MFKQEGAILAAAAGFVVLFTLLGLGVIQFSGMQSQGIEKQALATQAFWLAEAGIQRSITRSPPAEFIDPQLELGTIGRYTVTVDPYPNSSVRWWITSTATTNVTPTPITKTIKVQYGPNIDTAIMTTGYLDITGSAQNTITGPTEERVQFSFSDIFGLTEAQIKSQLTPITVNRKQDFPANLTGGNWVTLDSSVNSLSSNSSGSGLLVLEVLSDSFSMTGNINFSGIVWIIAPNLTLGFSAGNLNVDGAVYIQCPINTTSTFSGNSFVSYDPDVLENGIPPGQQAIDDAYGRLNGTSPRIVSWEEL